MAPASLHFWATATAVTTGVKFGGTRIPLFFSCCSLHPVQVLQLRSLYSETGWNVLSPSYLELEPLSSSIFVLVVQPAFISVLTLCEVLCLALSI